MSLNFGDLREPIFRRGWVVAHASENITIQNFTFSAHRVDAITFMANNLTRGE